MTTTPPTPPSDAEELERLEQSAILAAMEGKQVVVDGALLRDLLAERRQRAEVPPTSPPSELATLRELAVALRGLHIPAHGVTSAWASVNPGMTAIHAPSPPFAFGATVALVDGRELAEQIVAAVNALPGLVEQLRASEAERVTRDKHAQDQVDLYAAGEIEARNAQRHAEDRVVELTQRTTELEAQLAEARADSERLAWLDDAHHAVRGSRVQKIYKMLLGGDIRRVRTLIDAQRELAALRAKE